MSKIIIRKCVYFSDSDKRGFKTPDIKRSYGWVVVGFVGELGGTYKIPSSHEGMPIIGIVGEAYESMKEYGKASNGGTYFYPSISIDVDSMIFVMPAARKKDKPRIYPAFSLSGYPYYAPSYFCYDTTNEVATALTEATGGRIDYLYTSLGKVDLYVEKTQNGKVVDKEKYLLSLSLDISPSKMDEYKIGKYFQSPVYKISFKEISKVFDNKSSVFAWVKMNYTRDDRDTHNMAFAFNTILGTDDCIDAE